MHRYTCALRIKISYSQWEFGSKIASCYSRSISIRKSYDDYLFTDVRTFGPEIIEISAGGPVLRHRIHVLGKYLPPLAC